MLVTTLRRVIGNGAAYDPPGTKFNAAARAPDGRSDSIAAQDAQGAYLMVPIPLTTAEVAWICVTLAMAVLAGSVLLSHSRALPHLDLSDGRYGYVDGLRGIASLLVFLNHAPLVLI